MRPILPSDFGRKWLGIGIAVMLSCHHEPLPVPPGEPIPAEPDIVVDTMDAECNGLVAAIAAFGACPNQDDPMRDWAERVGEIAQQAFDAGKKGHPDAPSQHVIALACHKAAVSMRNATLRCLAGPRPKVD